MAHNTVSFTVSIGTGSILDVPEMLIVRRSSGTGALGVWISTFPSVEPMLPQIVLPAAEYYCPTSSPGQLPNELSVGRLAGPPPGVRARLGQRPASISTTGANGSMKAALTQI